MNKKILMAAFLALVTAVVHAQSGYLCIVDDVTGFHFDSDRGAWKQASFLPGERFEVTEFSAGVFRVQRLDDTSAWAAVCTRRADQSEDSFSCEAGTDQFHFNRKELRFTSFRYFGYWNGSYDSLSISIGRCAGG